MQTHAYTHTHQQTVEVPQKPCFHLCPLTLCGLWVRATLGGIVCHHGILAPVFLNETPFRYHFMPVFQYRIYVHNAGKHGDVEIQIFLLYPPSCVGALILILITTDV